MLESIIDILLIMYLGLGIVLTILLLVLVLVVQRNLFRLIRSLKKAASNIEDVTDTVVSKVSKPLTSGTSMNIGAGNILGILATVGRLFRNRSNKNTEG